MITSKTQLNSVIGFPLSHSMSPALHNALYKKLGIDAVLVAMPNKDIAALVRAIKTANIGMTVVTMPHKQAIMPYLDKVDPQAKVIDAVNTVINKNGKLTGFNTDIDGIAYAFRGARLKGKNALLLGGGGAARAVAYFLSKSRAKVFYCNRTEAKAKKLQKDFGGKAVKLKSVDPKKIDIVVNATPIGMLPLACQMPVPESFLHKGQIVFDVVYGKSSTELLKVAKRKGAKIIPGMEMFIGQAIRQVEIYSAKKLKYSIIYKFAKQQLF